MYSISSYIIVSVVLGCFSPVNLRFSLFPFILQFCRKDFLLYLLLFTSLQFSLRWFNINSANFNSVKLVY